MKKNIKITSAEYSGGYKIKITFSDNKVNIFDYESLVMRNHEESTPYINPEKFKKFKIVQDNLSIAWGKDWDMLLPINTLYNKSKVSFAGRKPIEDKQEVVRIWVKNSKINKLGGILQVRSICEKYLTTL